ncbi:MAG: hypothetical protein HY587_02545 [Candidatus Omnitrophica bacterium]|nr:hypothetical protein [Candidatus Omnitrophota bacterium]
MLYFGISNAAAQQGEDTFATFKGCVYNQRTGKPIPGAWVFVQALDSPIRAGQAAGADGCIQGIGINTRLIKGDYIEALFEDHGRTYRQQYQIPNGLIEQEYSYDFFLDVLHRRLAKTSTVTQIRHTR